MLNIIQNIEQAHHNLRGALIMDRNSEIQHKQLNSLSKKRLITDNHHVMWLNNKSFRILLHLISGLSDSPITILIVYVK